MKKLFLLSITIFLVFSPCYGQTWQETYEKAMTTYQKGKTGYDKESYNKLVAALEFANLALELAEKEFGSQNANYTKTKSLIKEIEAAKRAKSMFTYLLGGENDANKNNAGESGSIQDHFRKHQEEVTKKMEKIVEPYSKAFLGKKEGDSLKTENKVYDEMSENEILQGITLPAQGGVAEYRNQIMNYYGVNNAAYKKVEELSAAYDADDVPAIQRLEAELLKDAELTLIENIKDGRSNASTEGPFSQLPSGFIFQENDSSAASVGEQFLEGIRSQNKDPYSLLLNFYKRTGNRPKIGELFYWRLNIIKNHGGKEHGFYEETLLSLLTFYEKEQNVSENAGFQKFEAFALDLLSGDKEIAKRRKISRELAEFYFYRKEYEKLELTGQELVSEQMDVIARYYLQQGNTPLALAWVKRSIASITKEAEAHNGKSAPPFGGTDSVDLARFKQVHPAANIWLNLTGGDNSNPYQYYLDNLKLKVEQSESNKEYKTRFYADFFKTGLRSKIIQAQFYFCYDDFEYGFLPKTVKAYAKAEPLYREALATIEDSLGFDHPDNLVCADLADIYVEMARYKKAETYYLRCKDIRKRLLTFENYAPTVALTKLKLGIEPLKKDLVLTPDSVKAYFVKLQKTPWVSPEIFGNYQFLHFFLIAHARNNQEIIPDSMRAFINLLKAKDNKYAYHKARDYEYDGFLDLFHTYGLKELYSQYSQLAYGRSLYRLGKYYVTAGEFQNAGPILDEASAVINNFPKDEASGNRFFTKTEREITSLKMKLRGANRQPVKRPEAAKAHLESGKFAEAEVLFLLNLSKIEKKLRNDGYGIEHSDYVGALVSLAECYEKMGKFQDANIYYEQALSIQKKILGPDHPIYAQALIRFADYCVSQNRFAEAEKHYIQANHSFRNQIAKYFTDLNEKEQNDFYDSIKDHLEAFNSFVVQRRQASPSIVGELYNLRLATKGLLLNSRRKLQRSILTSGRKNLIDLFEKWTDKRSWLASLSLKKPGELDKFDIDFNLLKSEIDDLEKKLRRESKGDFNFKLLSSTDTSSWQAIQKRLKPSEAAVEIIHFKKQTEEVNYAALIITAKTTATPTMVLLENGNNLESTYYDKLYMKALREPNDVLYTKYWEPIAKKLSEIETVYLSQDGVYNLINLNTLSIPGKKGKYLLDEIDIHLISNIKDILQFSKKKKRINKSAVLISNNSKGDLKYAELEIEDINTILSEKAWKTQVYRDEAALEKVIKEVKKPTILHVATHGEFDTTTTPQETPTLRYVSPMIHSKLIFAEANDSQKNTPGEDDGFLTAYEAASLLLDETELVVLSACETGVGDNINGEGVYGLQRAFNIAGAKTIIMSL